MDGVGTECAWRAQSRRYHPDKLGATGNGNGAGETSTGDDGIWVAMREAYEVLMDPNARMAYDRPLAHMTLWPSIRYPTSPAHPLPHLARPSARSFGPKSITWSQATTIRDYLTRGLTDMATWYCITLGVQFLLAYCRPEMRPGKWVRRALLRNETRAHPSAFSIITTLPYPTLPCPSSLYAQSHRTLPPNLAHLLSTTRVHARARTE
ncbi:hypothetical protein QFC19_005477 [Naganishia cerealis]|uniref:Uncharacterized protein n=1 Tax=Naganishia cerealis TaxID=610337 RepID=A0ACC2VNJ9_9TREE|nr:hypothetical protein QFC19_005477 [Naganishia cerealis]